MESKEQKKLLADILLYEKNMADWGVKADKARRVYAEKYSEFKPGDKVIITTFDDKIRFGIVARVDEFRTGGFHYTITPKGKNWSDRTNRRALYHYSTKNPKWWREVKSIKKGC